MKKQLSQAAQVAKLIKLKAKKLGMKVTATSQYFSMGNSVSVKVLTGTDENFQKLKDETAIHEYGSFDGMTDCYNVDNYIEDLAQTKYLSIDDERAQYIMDTFKGDKYEDLTFKVNGEKVRSWYQFVHQLKKVCNTNDGWQHALKAMIQENFKFPFGKDGYLFEVENKLNQEAA
tara:strand:- start:86 stop:607 length:522 start_codon:yes stop_codon:yes gene_type:complete